MERPLDPAAEATTPTPSGSPRPGLRPLEPQGWTPRSLLTAGASLLALVGVLFLVVGHDPFDREGRRQDSTRATWEAARELVRRDPGFFGELSLYEREELEAAPEPPAGLHAAWPRESILEQRPRLLWSPAPGATSYVVSLVGEDGQDVWTATAPAEASALDWPAGAEPLPYESAWLWRVRAQGATPASDEASFRLAAERDAVRWARHQERIARTVEDPAGRAMITAQWALRRGHALEAFRTVREHLGRYPKDPYGRALERYLRRVHGLHD